jgi:hypothetical protein
VDGSTERDERMTVRVDDAGIVRLAWAPGVRIDGGLAAAAMGLVDRLNAAGARPLLVDMTGTAALTRDGRAVFTRKCRVSRLALLGRSPVDRVIANFALGVSTPWVPTRYFTAEDAALAWLGHDEPGG